MGVLEAYNLATTLAAYPCAEPSPVIYAATFIPAIAPALIEFASFGCRDILKFRAGVNTPCGRMIKGQFKAASPPKWWDAGQKLMKFERAASTAGFWFMIVDLAAETTVRWSTLAYKMAECPIALNQASWTWEPFFEDVLFPGVPKPVAGAVTGYSGQPGHATIVSAIAPEGWYVQLNFHVEYRPFPGHPPGTVTFWVQESGGTPYDFPGQQYGTAHYPWQRGSGGYQLKTQNHDHGARQYTMYALASERTIIAGASGHGAVSELPPMNLFLSPLNCWKDAFNETVPDPAGRNRKQQPKNILSPIFNAVTPKPVRGRPGGMPRSKK